MKICIAASAGGHLVEALQLSKAWNKTPHFFISDKRINAIDLAEKEKVYFILPPRRNILKFIYSFCQTIGIFVKENPSTVISTGAEIGFPALLLGAILGKNTIYIETIARVNSPSLTGKLVYPFVKHFYVQWPEARKWFPKAKYIGAVI